MRSFAAMLLLTLSFGATAHAQTTGTAGDAAAPAETDPVVAEAKTLFDEALSHLRDGRNALGLDLLRRSLVLYPTSSTRYNLGVALRLTGRTTEAIATFEGLRREELDDAKRSRLDEELARTRADLATLRVTVEGVPSANIELNGRVVGTAHRGVPFETVMDAGKHVVVAAAANAAGRKELDLRRGEVTETTIPLIELSDTVDPRRRRRRIAWITTAAAVVVGGVVTAVLLTRDRNKPLTSDPVTGNTVTR